MVAVCRGDVCCWLLLSFSAWLDSRRTHTDTHTRTHAHTHTLLACVKMAICGQVVWLCVVVVAVVQRGVYFALCRCFLPGSLLHSGRRHWADAFVDHPNQSLFYLSSSLSPFPILIGLPPFACMSVSSCLLLIALLISKNEKVHTFHVWVARGLILPLLTWL